MYKCEILADSLSPDGHRLTTMKITFPRFILAEFNTHRMFSRNSASSRAIPFKKMVKMVEENCFVPLAFQKDHKGMQGSEYIEDDRSCRSQWYSARDEAVYAATELNRLGVTKQLCNRLLEPFMWHTVIVTSGMEGFQNFFELRCPQYKRGDQVYKSWKEAGGVKSVSLTDRLLLNKSQAEIHIQAIAELMYDAYWDEKNPPKRLKHNEWHIPFGDQFDLIQLNLLCLDHFGIENEEGQKQMSPLYLAEKMDEYKLKIAIARCARISYETLGDDPKIDYAADIKLYNILAESGHFSPFEHVAKVMNDDEYAFYCKKEVSNISGDGTLELNVENGWCRNFRGFIQYRSLID